MGTPDAERILLAVESLTEKFEESRAVLEGSISKRGLVHDMADVMRRLDVIETATVLLQKLVHEMAELRRELTAIQAAGTAKAVWWHGLLQMALGGTLVGLIVYTLTVKK